ncbi:MAG: outer membrane beta-barrel protein [Brumimicrobium sp.]
MKKLLIMMLATSIVAGINAQEAAEKKILAGLTLGTGMNFNTPQTNAISSKVGADFYAGMSFDWHFAKNIAISTGIEFDFNRFRHEFNVPARFQYTDKEIVQRGDEVTPNSGESSYLLTERRYRNIYLTIPTMLRFQTNYMGYLRYFGKFGVRNSFLLTTRADNKGSIQPGNEGVDLEDMQNPGDLAIYKGSAGLSVGAEWNFSGSTCIVGEIGYYYGFSEIHKQDATFGSEQYKKDKNKSLYTLNEGDREYFTPSSKQGQIILKVSFLF